MAPDPTTQGQPPWWQRAALAGATGLGQQPSQQHQRKNPWGQFGQAAGKIGARALQDKLQQHQSDRLTQGVNPGLGSSIDQAIDSGQAPIDPGPAPEIPPDPAAAGGMRGTDLEGGWGGGASAGMSNVDNIGEPMANGGIVTKPTLALIGEHQPEAVVPLGYRSGAKVRPSMAMRKPAGRNYYGG